MALITFWVNTMSVSFQSVHFDILFLHLLTTSINSFSSAGFSEVSASIYYCYMHSYTIYSTRLLIWKWNDSVESALSEFLTLSRSCSLLVGWSEVEAIEPARMLDGSSTWEVIRLHPAVLCSQGVAHLSPLHPHYLIHRGMKHLKKTNLWLAIGHVFSKQVRAFFPLIFFPWYCVRSPALRQADKTSRERKKPTLTLVALFSIGKCQLLTKLLLQLQCGGSCWVHASGFCHGPSHGWRAAELPRPPTKDGDWPRGMAKKWDEAALSCLLRPGLQHLKFHYPKSC